MKYYTKHLAKCLASRKHSISGSYYYEEAETLSKELNIKKATRVSMFFYNIYKKTSVYRLGSDTA